MMSALLEIDSSLRRGVGIRRRECGRCRARALDADGAVRHRIVLAVEGAASQQRTSAPLALLIGDRGSFKQRERHRPGRDPVIVLLDSVHHLLYPRCHRTLVQAGLDPRLGFVDAEPGGERSGESAICRTRMAAIIGRLQENV